MIYNLIYNIIIYNREEVFLMQSLSSLHFKDSFVFIGSIILSVLIASPFIGLQGAIAWTSFSVLCTYSLYNAITIHCSHP